MAGLNAGSVYYTVEAETGQLLSSNKVVNTSIDKTKTSLKQLDTQVTKTAKAVNSSLSGVGRSAGQAGIQIQQFIGQVQGGQSAMLALSQQSADLGFVLGAPLLGAVVGISASIAGMLLPTLFDTTDSAETLEKVMTSLDKVITESQAGVNVLSNEYAKLAKQNKVLAEATAISQLKNIQNGLDAITDTITETAEGFEGFFGEIENADFQELSDYINKTGNSIENLNDNFYAQDGLIFAQKATKELQEQLGVTAEEALKVGSAMSKVANEPSLENIQNLGGLLLKLAKDQGPEAKQLLTDMQLEVNKLADKTVTLTEKQRVLEDVLNGVKVESEEQDESTENLSRKYELMAKSLKTQADMLGMSKSKSLEHTKALTLEEAASAGVSQETRNSIAASYDRQIAYAKEIEKTKEQEKADKKAAQAKKKSIKADQDAFEAMNALREADKKRKDEQANTVSRVGQSSDAMGLGIDTESRLQELQALHDAELISEQEFNAQKLSIMQSYNQQVMALNEQRFKQESEGNAFVMNSLDALGNASKNVFSGMLSGTMTVTDAVAAFGNAILNEAIGALVQMGIQQVKNQIIGKSLAAANVATAAASGAAMAAAYAPAATAASIATQGGAVTAGMSAVSTGTPIMNSMLSGMAHDGISEVPSEGTWLLNKGERVYTNDSAQKLDEMYNKVMLSNPVASYPTTSTSSNSQVVNNSQVVVNVASDGSTSTSSTGDSIFSEAMAKELGSYVEMKFKQLQAQSMKQGGSLWRSQQKGR